MNVGYPTNQVGDIMLAFIATAQTPSAASGFTLLQSMTTVSAAKLYIFWGYVSSVQSGTAAFPFTGSGTVGTGVIVSYSGASSTAPSAATDINTFGFSTNSGFPSVGFSGTSNYAIMALAANGTTTLSTESASPGSWTFSEALNNSSTVSLEIVDGPISGATSSTQLSGSYSTSRAFDAISIAVQPATAGAPIASFTASPTSGAAPLSVTFTDTSTNAPTSWSWNFGDSGTSTLQNPTHSYASAGTYTVALQATNGNGNNTSTQTNLITVSAPATVPGAPTGVVASAGNASASVAFTVPASNGGATITGYTVTSTPGSLTSSGSTSPITIGGLTNGIAYTFTVHATNSVGSGSESSASNSVTPSVAAGSTPVASFTGTPTSGSAPLTVAFTDTSTNTPTSWNWNFGDGTISTLQNPTHMYAAAGTYSVAMAATNSNGTNTSIRSGYVTVTGGGGAVTYTQSSITYTSSTLSSPTALSLSDDSVSSLITIPFSFSVFGTPYTSLYVGSNGILEFGSSNSNVISQDPSTDSAGTWPVIFGYGTDLVPSGTTQPKYQTLGTSPNRTFVVDYTSIPYYNGGSTTYKATFQIKLYETTNVVEVHVGTWQAGSVPIYGWLGIYDGTSNETTALSDSTSRSSVAYRFTPNSASATPAPMGSFLATPLTGAAPLTVIFTDISANSPTGWSWNFGDGSTNTTQNPTHAFSSPGTYSVMLTTTNTNGTTTYASPHLIHVTSPLAPVASFRTGQNSNITAFSIQFIDTSTNGPTAWIWDFGDGTKSRLQYPTHAYTTAGTYNVTLTVSNANGSDSMTMPNIINVQDQMSGIARRAISTVVTSANPGTSVTVTWPTNNVGDFALLVIATSGTVTVPAGWLYISISTGAAGAHVYAYWQYISNVQSGTVTVTTSSSVSQAAIVTYTNGTPQYPVYVTANASTANTALVTQLSAQSNYAILIAAVETAAAAMLTAETSSSGVNWSPSEAADSVVTNYPTLSVVDGATTNNSVGTLSATLSASGLWGLLDIHPKRYNTGIGIYARANTYFNSILNYPWTSWQTVAGFVAQTTSASGQLTPPTGTSAVARADELTMLPQSDSAVIVQFTGAVSAVEQYVIVGINTQLAVGTAGYSPSEIYVRLNYNATASSSSVSLWQGATQIGSNVTKTLTGTTTYTVRLMRLSGMVYSRVWATGTVEPTAWDFSVSLSSFPDITASGVPSVAVVNGTATTSRVFTMNSHDAFVPIAIETWTGTTGNPWPVQWTTDGGAGATIQSNAGVLTSPPIASEAAHAMLLRQPISNIDMYVTVTGSAASVVQTVIIGSGSPADLNSTAEWLSGVNVRLNYAASASASTVSLYARDTSLTSAVTMTLTGTTSYRVRLQLHTILSTAYLRAKVWAASSAEPTTWTISFSPFPQPAYYSDNSIGYPAVAIASGTSTPRQFTFSDLHVVGSLPTSIVKPTLPLQVIFGASGNLWPGSWTKILGVDGTSGGSTGTITTPSTIDSSTRYEHNSLPDMGNVDVFARFSMTSFTTAAYMRVNINGNTGGSYRSPNDGYYVELQYGSNSLCLGTMNGGVDLKWPSVAKTLTTATVYGVRIQRVGQVLRVRVWDYSGSEPTTWDDTRTILGTPVTGKLSVSLSNLDANTATGTFNTFTISNPSLGNLKAYLSGTFSALPIKVWNGTVWEPKPIKRWDGTNWNLTNY